MNEIDCIRLCSSCRHGVVTGLSYNCCKDTLVVSFLQTVLEIRKGCEETSVLYTTTGEWIVDVLCLSPYLLLTVLKGDQYVVVGVNQCGEKIGCCTIEGSYLPKNLLYNPCSSSCPSKRLWAFVLKRGCYPYLCCCGLSLWDFGVFPCKCNDVLCECCCEEPSGCTPCEDIMESIALVETALSHILNAEGEKLQKVLATTDNISQIMCVNREVNKTIVNVTHLEQTLYAKLSALSDCGLCGDPCDETGDCQRQGHHCGSDSFPPS